MNITITEKSTLQDIQETIDLWLDYHEDQKISVFTEESTAKNILAAIDKWAIYAPAIETCMLWDILSALRGPDFDDFNQLKYYTTAVVRSHSLPHLAGCYATVNTINSLDDARDFNKNNPRGHFSWHITEAIMSLKAMK